MIYLGKIFIFLGLLLVIFGVFILIASKVPLFGKLPGDILIKKENFTFYFPLATSLLLSLILTIVLNLIFKIFKNNFKF